MQTNPDEVVIDDDEFDEPTQPAVQTNPDEVVIDEDFDEPPSHANPDEVLIDDADFDDLPVQAAPPPANPDEVVIDDNFDETAETAAGGIIENDADLQRPLDESVDLVEAAFAHGGQAEAEQVKEAQGNNDNVPEATEILVESAQAETDGSRRITKFLALDKCGPGKDFIQVKNSFSKQRQNLTMASFSTCQPLLTTLYFLQSYSTIRNGSLSRARCIPSFLFRGIKRPCHRQISYINW
jgi:lariat debranching enzyme